MESMLKQKNPSFFVKIYILVSIAQGLRFLKLKSIVHMDLSLGNILMNQQLLLKLIDFGESYESQICKSSTLLNTVDYNPGFTLPFAFPELFRPGSAYTNKSDIFSFSIIVFQIIFSFFPYPNSFPLIYNLKKGTYFQKFYFAPEACSYVGYEKIVIMLLALISKGMSPDEKKRPHPSKSIIILKDLFYWIQD